MDAYSEDLRQRVVQACDEGVLSREEIAEHFHVSTSWIRRLLQRRRETGSFSALPGGRGPKPKLSESHLSRLSQLVDKHPDATLRELKRRGRFSCSLPTIYRALRSLGLTLKKSHSAPANKTVRTSSKQEDLGRIA
jgi:transposase